MQIKYDVNKLDILCSDRDVSTVQVFNVIVCLIIFIVIHITYLMLYCYL